MVSRLGEILSHHKGDTEVRIRLQGPRKTTVLRLDRHRVQARPGALRRPEGAARPVLPGRLSRPRERGAAEPRTRRGARPSSRARPSACRCSAARRGGQLWPKRFCWPLRATSRGAAPGPATAARPATPYAVDFGLLAAALAATRGLLTALLAVLVLGHGDASCGGSRGQGRYQTHIARQKRAFRIITVRNRALSAPRSAGSATPMIEFRPLTPARSGRLEGNPKQRPSRERGWIAWTAASSWWTPAICWAPPRAFSPESPRVPGSPSTTPPSSRACASAPRPTPSGRCCASTGSTAPPTAYRSPSTAGCA